MEQIDPRATLERLIRERREDYASLSRLLGKNAAYIQQFIKRGTPRRLPEDARHTLARYFGIEEQELGGPPPTDDRNVADGLIAIPRYDVSASAGSGALDGSERPVAHIGFEPRWLERLSRARPRDLSIIRVEGDSMFPTLGDGDDIMVDRSSALRKVQDGIYVLRRDDTLLVKRITVHPSDTTITISSDNPTYARWPDCRPEDVTIIGRVIWAGRKIR